MVLGSKVVIDLTKKANSNENKDSKETRLILFKLSTKIPNTKFLRLLNLTKEIRISNVAIIIRIIFFLFKINPKIPIKNKNNDRFIVMFMYFCDISYWNYNKG